MLTTVVFDADHTLLDLDPAVHGGLIAVLAELRRLTPAADDVSVADLRADFAALFAARPADSIVEIRRAAFVRSLDRVGLAGEADRILELFFARRFALTRPFDDALPALAALRRSYTLGYATNGNSRADRCGLAAQFSFEIYAHQGGVPKKPAPAFFAAVASAATADPAALVYVGDSPEHDVRAPQAAGLRAVWLNRDGRPRPAGLRPDAEIRSLAELPAVLAAWR